jgi:glycosyltransferase involved in cell wall biosynthesis
MKISVIIPAYNAEKYISTSITSCLKQSYLPHEIIVVDDASTDGTVGVAESFPPPVRVIRLPENSGVSIARNRGVAASSGDWIAFLDADDWFLSGKLERQRSCAVENNQAILIYSGFKILLLDGSECDGRFVAPRELWPMLRYRNPILTSAVLMRRDVFDSVQGFDRSLRTAQDWDLWLKIVARYPVDRFAAVPEVLVKYRKVAGSLSSSAMRYFGVRISLLEKRCLFGTSGPSRFLWRRRISAFNYYDTSIALREAGSSCDLQFVLKSILLWPFPWRELPMRRYKVAAVMLKQHLFKQLTRLTRVNLEGEDRHG